MEIVTPHMLIKEIRERQKMSQAKLARQAGLSRQQVIRLEHGQHVPRPETLGRIARALEVPPCLLLGWVDLGSGVHMRMVPSAGAQSSAVPGA